MLLADIISSCLHELPAATALAVAEVMGFVYRITSSAVADLSTLSKLSNPYNQISTSYVTAFLHSIDDDDDARFDRELL